ncbi:hypothetical protein PoB_007109300 [Plakobranchus ocellatus]|uniref:Uncharacterized protein n=1 Tax=Plakobranchus ocellatus TaxID=259542 RepID=A0AAV4DKI0_9GAST|nr:hypothetical protein PoB_007109300 [Plakobranchus ocellatus]
MWQSGDGNSSTSSSSGGSGSSISNHIVVVVVAAAAVVAATTTSAAVHHLLSLRLRANNNNNCPGAGQCGQAIGGFVFIGHLLDLLDNQTDQLQALDQWFVDYKTVSIFRTVSASALTFSVHRHSVMAERWWSSG